MCGINGYFDFSASGKNKGIISKMNDKIVHRGPDDDGVFEHENISLGMRRLAIIGIEDGAQPIFNEDRSKVIVFNGEIYNYKSLKPKLVEKGHIFTTSCDTEVVLHLYEEYGNDCFNMLIGMFAVAIYDLNTKKLVIARDNAGEKPLHYYHDNDKFLLASELKSLFCEKIDKTIDKKALNQYLRLTYIPAPLTIYRNIFKLMPGHLAEITATGDMTIKKYWDVAYNNEALIEDYASCKKQLRKTMFDAVEECMVSDIPVGAFLSGGIDSSIVVGIMSKISPKPISTFTIGYNSKHYDESNLAQKTADLNNTDHHVFMLDYDEAVGEIDTIVGALDEPFADSSSIPTYMVSKEASKYVKTVLTGDAGDELFAGYQKYLIGHYTDKINKLPRWLADGVLKKAVYALPDKTPLSRKARKVFDNADKPIFEQRKSLIQLGFKDHELNELLVKEHGVKHSLILIDEYYNKFAGVTDEISQAQYTDFKLVLEGDMFHKVDRMSMLCSLETRSPIIHKNVVELAAKIPSKYKINNRDTKMIFKETFSDLLAKEVLEGKKRGFSVPIGQWLKDALKSELESLLDRDFIEAQGLFNYAYIQKLLEEHFTDRKNRFSELWLLFVFQSWYKREIVG